MTQLEDGAIAVFVKTPGLSPLKTRLAAGIGAAAALEFYRFSVKAVEETVKQSGLAAFWAVGEEGGLNDPLWDGFEKLWTGEGDLGARQHHVYETLLQKHERVILIGADAPQLSPMVLNEATAALEGHDFVIGPARDGGYTLFGGRVRVAPEIWNSVSWSSDTTRSEFESALPSKVFHLPFLTDVDEEEDLASMAEEMPETVSASQQKLIDWVSSR